MPTLMYGGLKANLISFDTFIDNPEKIFSAIGLTETLFMQIFVIYQATPVFTCVGKAGIVVACHYL